MAICAPPFRLTTELSQKACRLGFLTDEDKHTEEMERMWHSFVCGVPQAAPPYEVYFVLGTKFLKL